MPTSHHGPISARQPNASCLISNIVGAYWVQARTVWIQIRLQVLSKIVSENDQKIPQSQTEDISSFRPTIRLFADRSSIGLFFILRGKHMAKYDIHIIESLPGFWETGENDIYSRGTGNKGQILSGTGYKCNIGEHGT